MRILLILILAFLITDNSYAQEFLIDFGANICGQNWYVTDDGVMGGLSSGKAYLSDSSVVFTGTVSLENNGGFSSLRSPYHKLNLEEFKEVEIRARATGLPFSITFSKSRQFWVPNYKYFLNLDENEWKVIRFNMDELKEYRLGDLTGRTISKSDIKNIISISFFNEGKMEGEFTLEVDYIIFRLN